MFRVIFLSLLLSGFTKVLYSQYSDCTDTLCLQILHLREENSQKSQRLYQLELQIEKLTADYVLQQKETAKNTRSMKELEASINESNLAKRKVEQEKLALTKELEQAFERLRNLSYRSEAQERMLKAYEAENKTLKDEKRDWQDEAHQMAVENGFFYQVELGYVKNGYFWATKRVKDEEEVPVDARPLWSDRLNRIRISGKAYMPINKYLVRKEIPGKLLLYANYQLLEAVDYTLVSEGNRRFYQCFEMDKVMIELRQNFPEGTTLQVAFMDELTYASTPKEITRQFWVAHSHGLLAITSLKPHYLSDVLTIDKILSTSKVMGNVIKARHSHLTIRLFDNATVDHDRADFYLNDTKIVSNLILSDKGHSQEVLLKKGLNRFSIVALDTGSEPPCTVLVQVLDGDRFLGELVLHGDIGYSESLEIEVD